MTDADDPASLAGSLLIAMPGMGDPRFDRTVVFLCVHSGEGAMGLIVNKPAPGIAFRNLLEQLEIEPGPEAAQIRVHYGGPVEQGRGFVLHSMDYAGQPATLDVDGRFGMTTTLDILEDIARGNGPQAVLMALGYAGWGPGQLEAELQRNGWLTAPAAPEIVFGRDDGGKWEAAVKTLGIRPSFLSADGGSA
ncbi:MAG TPA: YqgE/AlgH family protein [Rhodobacteraceae bacterium]|nr:YqgE/AlgH family protein [Paracoccaceae bacterium]HBH00005.1 YqgE/AlgH family protein [Paracoccaceae bacterium]